MQMNLKMLLMLLTILGVSMAGFASANPSDREAPSPRKTPLWDEFVIVAHGGPPPEAATAARYREIADAGIDVIIPANGIYTAEQNLKAMDLAQGAGLRVIPMDLRCFAHASAEVRSIDEATLESLVADYRNHPAFACCFIKDEPNKTLFPSLRRLRDRLLEKDHEHEPFINLFPSYASPAQLGTANFQDYVHSCLEIVRPRLLAYDFYPLREKVTVAAKWFSDLTIVREETRSAEIPFWVFVQSQGLKDYLRVPNRAEVFWQANTALAYGARGICWFSYWTPLANQEVHQIEGEAPLLEQHYGAMLDVNGVRTPVYDYVREANVFLHHAGRALIGWDNSFVACYQGGKLLEGGVSPTVTPFGEDANLVVGTFRKKNRSRILIANSSWENPAHFRLETIAEGQVVRLLTRTETNVEKNHDVSGSWTLEPGGALLLEAIPPPSSASRQSAP